ncbi:ARM repeat-containing protein [Myriangium duriaei CBS 260.36]|uniref:ARM repeat-containing protein n=1 Tax=Myriangium duriaei CBS 260.36 TaxID=1168546 RepID=A0A9P4MHQ1_9PEZI|nr:ARM repeat-containing protein [Myriangium duriaei CBS 260.36]
MAATNGGGSAFAPVLTALSTMQSNVDRAHKDEAHKYLEQFQKSSESWTTVFTMLSTADATSEAKLFAATTLKGKIVYDLHQLPRESLTQLRDSLLAILGTFSSGPKPIRTQLCVCMANLAIQMLDWKDVLATMIAALGHDASAVPCLMEFLRVLPEEVTEGRKINLTEDELRDRTSELLEENGEQVLSLLKQYAQSTGTASKEPYFLECVTSWIREIPLNAIVDSALMDVAMASLNDDAALDAGVECLCAMFRETKDVDSSMDIIKSLYPRVLSLRPRIQQAASAEDPEALKSITRVLAEAGEAWVVLIARLPEDFRALVEAILECAVHDKDTESISLTFNFWYELKQYITLERYMPARAQLADIYSKLVDIITIHLQYPKPEDPNSKDLFDGDREQEDRFRGFRHNLGDVLKDCCEVIGVTECLQKSYVLIEKWVHAHGQAASHGNVPDWQQLEAPIFSMRAMGKMVPSDENIMLPRLIPLLVDIPDHEKVRFQAVMALGRYTEWTAKHPETLEKQLNFILASFDHQEREVRTAAALSFRFFCNDCADLLKDFVGQLQQFYQRVLSSLPPSSQEEITEGVASVIAVLPPNQIYHSFKMTCDPVVAHLMETAQAASSSNDEKAKYAVADQLQLITLFIQWIKPIVPLGEQNPAVQYCQEIFPTLGAIADNFTTFVPILERVCRCWRYMVLSYRTATTPMLPMLAEKLAAGFASSRQGCFLWATDSIVREFTEDVPGVDKETSAAVFHFFEQQATNFLRALNDLAPEELPDVIEDFFRLITDVLLYHPLPLVRSTLMPTILAAATSTLTVLKEEPILATLHFLRDFLACGTPNQPRSHFSDEASKVEAQSPEVKQAVIELVQNNGEALTQRVMAGMMYTFPPDCIPDASGVVLALFQLVPSIMAGWVANTVTMLPAGSITPQEQERLLRNIEQRIQSNEVRKIRMLLQDFTSSYRRRNVAPREGLGRLEATRFKFSG